MGHSSVHDSNCSASSIVNGQIGDGENQNHHKKPSKSKRNHDRRRHSVKAGELLSCSREEGEEDFTTDCTRTDDDTHTCDQVSGSDDYSEESMTYTECASYTEGSIRTGCTSPSYGSCSD